MPRLSGLSQQRVQGSEDPPDPEMMQQYMDYMILDPSQSAVHMQTPLMDPYTYRQVEKVVGKVSGMSCSLRDYSLRNFRGLEPCEYIRSVFQLVVVILPPSVYKTMFVVYVSLQQQYGYQEEEERSLNSLDDNPAFPLLASPSRSRSRSNGNPLDRDRQLLQDLVSFYLTSPSSSSSSASSPLQSPSHRTAGAGFPSSLSSSSSSSSSSFYPELDFPLDYGEDYVSQMAQLRKQQQLEQAKKKAQEEYDSLSGLNGERGIKGLFIYHCWR